MNCRCAVLTLSKVVVEVGNRADAARAGDYRLESAAAPEAFARADYQLEAEQAERVAERPGSSLWLGPDDALARFGVRRGQAIERDAPDRGAAGPARADRGAATPAGIAQARGARPERRGAARRARVDR